MRKMLTTFKRYIEWKLEYKNQPPVFPFWCDTGGKMEADAGFRHTVGEDESIVWEVAGDKRIPHYDHLEMSGFHVSAIISYGVNKTGELKLSRHVIFPTLRKIPNETRGSLSHNFCLSVSVGIKVNGVKVSAEYPRRIRIKGFLEIASDTNQGLEIVRTLMPTVHCPALIEKVTLINKTGNAMNIEVTSPGYLHLTNPKRGVEGAYEVRAGVADDSGSFVTGEENGDHLLLAPGDSKTYYLVFAATKEQQALTIHSAEEERARLALVDEWFGSLKLETPDPVLNTAFNFAKVRGSESIFRTKNGLMHGPGGGSYYAALWTNDQCEYMNPFFPFLGYDAGNEQSINCYSLYMDRMDPEYKKPLVTSIIAEGEDYWNGAGDRGDAAMFAYGAARFCLAYGDRSTAEKLWPGIAWAIEFSLRQKTTEGVIRSDSDELENRFKSGEANLFTSCLLYDALHNASLLAKELGGNNQDVVRKLSEEAELLKLAIEAYFGGRVEGYETYRYYKGNEVLRAWICVPLTMGIYERKAGTLQALFSPRLWTINGLSSQAGKETFWDRSTLYALRGVFTAGEPDLALKHLTHMTKQRLLGEHVPYSVEAYPEGNQRHLSAESGLYARIFTEGLFEIRPTGFKTMTCNPHLPSAWNEAALRNVKAFQTTFDLEVSRSEYGRRLKVHEKGRLIFDRIADESEPFSIVFIEPKETE